MQLPEKIAKLISNEIYTTDKIGMSESSVLLFENKVLKIQEYNKESENEALIIAFAPPEPSSNGAVI